MCVTEALYLGHTLKIERNSVERPSLAVGVPWKHREGEESHHSKQQTLFPGTTLIIIHPYEDKDR